MAAVYVFDIPAFRVGYPEFADPLKFPDLVLQGYWDTSTCYIANANYGSLRGDCRYKAITLMTAHIARLSSLPAGSTPSIASSATVGAVSVTTVPPPIKTQFQWWLNTTPYGMMLLALLNLKGVGGISVGGLPEKSAFRKVGGVFF